MGLLSKLTTIGEGSTLSFSDGETPFTNPLSTKESQLHYNTAEDKPGYSVTGTQFSIVNLSYQEYEDGKNTPLPEPTTFDLLDPITADPNYKPKYTPTPGQTYSELYNTF
jgi:hypothetical protein